MSDQPNPMTERDLERELVQMTEPTTEPSELWREALQRVRRERGRGTRRIPGRRRIGRATGIGALVTASLALAVSVFVWPGSESEPVVLPETAAAASAPISSGMDITRALDRMLPQSASVRRDAELNRQLQSLQDGRAAFGSYDAQIDLRSRADGRSLNLASDESADMRPSRTPMPAAPAEPQSPATLLEGDAVSVTGSAAGTMGRPAWRLLERRADVGIRVQDVASTASAVETIADTNAGEFVSERSVQGEGHRAKAGIVMRVAADRYDAVLEQVSALGAVVSSEARADDLSLMADDLDVRMLSAEKTERDYSDLYHNYGTSERNEAEGLIRQSAGARSEVNRLMAERAKLVDRAAWSTVRVLIVADPPPRPPRTNSQPRSKSFLAKVIDEAREAGHNAGHGVLVIIRAATVALPTAAVLVPLGLLLWWRLRKRSGGGE